MRLFLSLMAMAMLVVAVGCEKPTSTASSNSGDAGPATTSAPAQVDMGSPDDAPEVSADTSAMQEVSLKLPGMT